MRLLVSVSDASETEEALGGGADIIDAKDPSAGPLGAVGRDIFVSIVHAVAGGTPVSAALGDAGSPAAVRHLAQSFATSGAAFIKLGFDGSTGDRRVRTVLRMAVAGAREGHAQRSAARCGVVAVAYADSPDAETFVFRLIDLARQTGASGVLLDTANKTGPGLCACLSSRTLNDWRRAVASAGLFSALAGRLTRDDVARLQDVNPDIVGVRGAACIGGRGGRVSAERVRMLKAMWPSSVARLEDACAIRTF